MVRLIWMLVALSLVVKAFSNPLLGGKEEGRRTFKDWKIIIYTTGEFPYMAAVEVKGQFKCGAAIIHTNIVLTAAHCVKGIAAKSLRVRAGTFTKRDKTGKYMQKLYISEKVVHENFKGKGNKDDFDIAILKSKQHFNFNDFVNAIQLAEEDQVEAFNKRQVIALGFGEMEEYAVTDHLRSAKLRVLSKAACKISDSTLTENMLCTMGYLQQAGLCTGDSGGPLIANHNPRIPQNDTLIGIASFSISSVFPPIKCNLFKPSVFADVAVFRSWIDSHI